MSLRTAEEHGLVYVIKQGKTLDLPTFYVRKAQIIEAIEKHVLKFLSSFNGEKFIDYDRITLEIFGLLQSDNLISRKDTEVAGTYFKYDGTNFSAFRNGFLKASSLFKLASEIGDRYFVDAFSALEKRPSNDLIEEGLTTETEKIDFTTSKPNPQALATEFARNQFIAETTNQIQKIEESNLTNTQKSEARGYLQAVTSLADTPDPPIDLIWEILNRANSIAGIASFFVSLIGLIIMVNS